MKALKFFIPVLMCVQIVLSAFEPFASAQIAKAAEEEENVSLAQEKQVEVEVEQESESLFPECTLEWMSVYDAILDQVRVAWNYPETYVGNQVSFMPFYSSFECWSGVEGESTQFLDLNDELLNARLEIEDYYYDEAQDILWYKVKAVEGQTLPEILQDNPYVYQLSGGDVEAGISVYPPTFLVKPFTAVWIENENGEVEVYKQVAEASKTEIRSVEELPAIVEVEPVYVVFDEYVSEEEGYCEAVFCDLGEEYGDYRYVRVTSLQLIPAETAKAHQMLTETESVEEYYALLSQIPTETLAKLSEVHRTALDQKISELLEQENQIIETEVTFGDVTLPVRVQGNIPANCILQVSSVDDATTMSAGFNIDSAEDIIVSLDINVVSMEDGSLWQPEDGNMVNISIGMAELGYEDCTMVKVHRKHGDQVENFDVFFVENGAVTIRTNGFSIYAVSSSNDTRKIPANKVSANSEFTLEVTDKQYYMFTLSDNQNTHYTDIGAWQIDDPEGAIHYTVYSNGNIGNGGMNVRWIMITALKEAEDIEIYYYYRQNNNLRSEKFTLNIVPPKASAEEEVIVYLKDDVNHSGRLIATLVDENGNEVKDGLEGAAFSWSRDDGYYITTKAYEDEYRSVNIAVDHGGLVEARKNEQERRFVPTTYTVDVILADGRKRSATYTVYYQSEIINADFEFPNATDNTHTYFPNGWAELYWKTTAPGHTATDGRSHISKDIEYGDVTSGRLGNTDFGVRTAASGVQFAELNAEAFGALYQDIITVPDEDIVWNFSHAPRTDQNWGGNRGQDISNAMYIVIGATEDAQKLQQQDLLNIGDQADEAGKNDLTFKKGESPIVLTYTSISGNTAEYYVWFHDSGTFDNGATVGWTNLEGKYKVPLGQYRTRLFFVSKESINPESLNAGNLIDATTAGQYKKYLIEYYIGKVDINNQLVIEKYQGQQTNKALMYSFVELTVLEELLGKNQYLHKIMINGENYPYSIRHTDKNGKDIASLYIEKYPKAEGFKEDPNMTTNKYADYDIVMQVYLREVVISVEKNIVFPEGMSEEQKLTLIEGKEEGEEYTANITVSSQPKEGDDYRYTESGVATITKRDPSGKYVGYYAGEEQPKIGYTYTINEEACSELPGLVLESTTYSTKLYQEGKYIGSTGKEFTLSAGTQTAKSINFAEVLITNTYEEVMTTISYQAVGNGKISFKGTTDYVDTPTETIRFYTQEAEGANVSPGKGATFVGWYIDPECTKPVEAKHGVVNGSYFKPNANIVNTTEITFYAKFETASIVIEREDALPGQSFVYHIEGTKGEGKDLDMYVTLVCDKNGYGMVTISEVLLGEYTIEECEDWTWRYPSQTQTVELTDKDNKATATFGNEANDLKWLNGYSSVIKNVFGKNE